MSARKLITATAIAATAALSVLPAAAEAHGRGRYHHDDDRGYERADYRRSCRSSGTTGLIVGGAAGALVGRQLDGGRDRTTGTILGAGAGALLGREISRKSRC